MIGEIEVNLDDGVDRTALAKAQAELVNPERSLQTTVHPKGGSAGPTALPLVLSGFPESKAVQILARILRDGREPQEKRDICRSWSDLLSINPTDRAGGVAELECVLQIGQRWRKHLALNFGLFGGQPDKQPILLFADDLLSGHALKR